MTMLHPAQAKTAAASNPTFHLYLRLSSNYAPPNNQNYGVPDKSTGGYQLTASIYNLKKLKEIFDCIMKSQITMSVEELCSTALNVQNQI